MSRSLFISILLLLATLTGAGLISAATNGSSDGECETIGEDEIEVCDEILHHWEANGGTDLFGEPLSQPTSEVDAMTQDAREVQYFERARLEHHPELEGTPYVVQVGRLGAELLAADGIEWSDLEKSDPDEESYFDRTGQAIAPEFQVYWNENGLDLGNGADSFQQSLALFGYPVTPAEEIESDGGSVLVQWFERARLEQDPDGSITAAPLGVEAGDSSERLSLRAQREIDTALFTIYDTHEAPGIGVWLNAPQLGTFEWSYGYADREGLESYTHETHHRIGSVTKPIVGNLVLQLVDEGLLNLDDTVDQWFPELDGAEDVTVRMLGNMTSGIFNYTEVMAWASEMIGDPERAWEPEELLDFGFRMTETASPDGSWSYSNTNYVMLGMIIEHVTGNGLADELQERIFDPLDLPDTSFPEVEDASMPEPYAHAESMMGLGSTLRDSTGWNPSWAWAAGQIISTPADMLEWAPELYESELLSEEMQAARLELVDVVPEEARDETPGSSDAAYGFGVLHDRGWYAHDGLIAGYLSMVAYHPEREASLVVFANSDALSDDYTLPTGLAYERIQQILAREFQTEEYDS